MAEPAVGAEGEVQEDGGYGTAGDEEGFQGGGANVGDVGYGLPRVHGGVVASVFVGAPVDEQAEEGAEPDYAGDYWKNLEKGHCVSLA